MIKTSYLGKIYIQQGGDEHYRVNGSVQNTHILELITIDKSMLTHILFHRQKNCRFMNIAECARGQGRDNTLKKEVWKVDSQIIDYIIP